MSQSPVLFSAEDAKVANGNVRLRYDSQEHFQQLVSSFGMLQEWKDGIPRCSYKDVVRNDF